MALRFWDPVPIACSGDIATIDSAKGIRAALEMLHLHVELTILSEWPEYSRFFRGERSPSDFLILDCHGGRNGLIFPITRKNAAGDIERNEHCLQAADVGQMRAGDPAGAILALSCVAATSGHAGLFRNSGFKYYIAHNGCLLEDAKLLYPLTFFAHLRAGDRDSQPQNFSILEAHEAACRVLPMENATRGFQIFEIPHDVSPTATLQGKPSGAA